MNHHVLSHHAVPLAGPRASVLSRLYHAGLDSFLLLPIGAAIALLWANTASESYFEFAHASSFAVNDVAMAFFLALIVQEVLEALMRGGALHSFRFWGLPLIAAAGGMLGATGVYLAYVHWQYETVLVQAWPVMAAIDVAVPYYLLKTVWRRSNALPFFLLLALVTDAFGVLVIALRPGTASFHNAGMLLLATAVGSAALLAYTRVRSFWPYLAVCGTASWVGLYMMDLYPALALVPIVPFLPREPRSLDVFADRKPDDAVHRFEHEWNEGVQVVLFLFGLVNAGVILKGYDTGTWAMLAASLVGRPLGVVVAVAVAAALGFRLPARVGWREIAIVALATSCGFTFALFFATGTVATGPILAQIKLGALGTAAAIGVTLGAARLLHVGRFARHEGRRG